MPATDIGVLLEEAKCYACYGAGSVPELAKLALLSSLASGGGGCTTPPDAPLLTWVDVTGDGAYTVYWDAVAGATSYWVFIYAAPVTDPPGQVNDANTTNTFAAFTDADNLERAAFVYAINDCGNSPNSNFFYFNSSLIASVVDTFEDYAANDDLGALNGGINWALSYVSRTRLLIVEDTFESYIAADPLNGLNDGTNWTAAYVSRP